MAIGLDTARCEAQLGWRLESRNGFPHSVADMCGQVVGLRRYEGADAATHFYCRMPGHEEQVRRDHPEDRFTGRDASAVDGLTGHERAAMCGCWSIIHAAAGCPNVAEPHPEGDDPQPCANCQPFEAIGVHADAVQPGDAAYAGQFYGGHRWAPGELVEAFGK